MEVRDLLNNVYDLERLMTRVIYQKATPRDLKSLSMTAQQLPELKAQLRQLAGIPACWQRWSNKFRRWNECVH